MSDIPHWKIPPGYVEYHGAGLTTMYVEVVTYADHLAAVAAARTEEQQRINSMLVVDYVREQYERGAADKAAELQDYYGEQAHGHYMDGYKMGYAKGIIEGDSGGRKEGYRAGYAAGKDAVMTSSYEQAVAEGEREALSKWIDGVAKGRADAAKEVAELDLASCESMIEHISRWAAVNAARGTDSSNEGRNTG